MNNQVSKLLNVNFPKPNHSNFNLGRKNVISADVGYLYPVYVEEVLANSYKRLDVEALIQCNATVAPVMGSFTTKLEAFFVPLRIYHQHLLNNDRSNNYEDDFPLHYFPWLKSNDSYSIRIDGTLSPTRARLYNDNGSLLEYLGMFPAGWNSLTWLNNGQSNLNITAYPFIGYFDIFRNYYANPYDENIPFRVNNDAFSYVDYNNQARADGIVSLKYFDSFINSIRSNSVTSANVPAAVDAFELFNKHFIYNRLVTNGDNSSQFVTTSVPLFVNGNVDYYSNNGLHFGLLRRTYKDDYFNARISSSFVQYLREQSKVVVTDGSFDISQLRLANRIAKYVDKLGFSDSRFGTWLKVHFGTRLNDRIDVPQFLGSVSSTLNFQDIISNAQTGSSDVITSNEALGSRAGLGAGYIKNKGSFFEFKSVEPGYIIVLFSIVPNVTYCQGVKKMYLRQRFSDIYTPEFDAVGYQDLHTVELSAIGYSVDRSNIKLSSIAGPLAFADYNAVVGKQPSWLEYMTSIDESHGLVQDFTQYGYWTLNRPFDLNAYYGKGNNKAPSLNYSTYIQPELFNNIFAVNKNTDNFQCQFRFYDRTSQPMSKQVLPRL